VCVFQILMALVSMKVGNFIDLSEKELHQSVTKDASGTHHPFLHQYGYLNAVYR